ncbi:hypothetical protein PGT21_003511 [Puccinia graminis f. sp. tritici]|uniref:Uncharacterized protein n=1 Tax=Puccinia graminis f. sp. tritici TaxID=56615 RepID=A0A5B0NK86_PUCGR|nr:hypothetical protein PGT21_003511 [Puccinia graminis f. sp. tritici]
MESIYPGKTQESFGPRHPVLADVPALYPFTSGIVCPGQRNPPTHMEVFERGFGATLAQFLSSRFLKA